MEKIIVNGGSPLCGRVEISGSKNAALPIIYACALVRGKCVLENIPAISDIADSFEILRGIGAKIRKHETTLLELSAIAEKMGALKLPGSGRQEYLENIVNSILFR